MGSDIAALLGCIREQDLSGLFADVVQRIQVTAEVAEWIKAAPRESQDDKERFHRTAVLRLQQQYMAVRAKIDRAYEDDNWDVAEHRERILRRELPAGPLWIFDEIHKWRAWRNYLKGLTPRVRASCTSRSWRSAAECSARRHPDTLISVDNLAATLEFLGDTEGARKLRRRVGRVLPDPP